MEFETLTLKDFQMKANEIKFKYNQSTKLNDYIPYFDKGINILSNLIKTGVINYVKEQNETGKTYILVNTEKATNEELSIIDKITTYIFKLEELYGDS